MPRKVTKSLVRTVKPDRLYNSTAVAKLINRVMLDGKKQLAERLVYNGMQKAANKLKVQNPLEVFEQAMKNVQPHLETRSRRVGGLALIEDGLAEALDANADSIDRVRSLAYGMFEAIECELPVQIIDSNIMELKK
jgi:hypothetical protein